MSGAPSGFGARLGQAQDAWLEEVDHVDAVREHLFDAVVVPPRLVAPTVILAAIPLAAVAVIVAALWVQPDLEATLSSGPPPTSGQGLEGLPSAEPAAGVRAAAGAWIQASDRPQTLDFSDGSRIGFAPGSEGRLAALDPRGAHLLLERGQAELTVVPREGAAWTLEAGPFDLRMTSAAVATAEWRPDQRELRVQMRTGALRINGPHLGEGRVLSGVERLAVWLDEGRSEIASGPPASARAVGEDLVEVEVQPASPRGP